MEKNCGNGVVMHKTSLCVWTNKYNSKFRETTHTHTHTHHLKWNQVIIITTCMFRIKILLLGGGGGGAALFFSF